MFWLYVPPVVLVGSLIILVVVLGKKSTEFKKIRKFQRSEGGVGIPEERKYDLKKIRQHSLHFFENILSWLKTGIKKSENYVSKLTSRIRARQSRPSAGIPTDDSMKFGFGKSEEKKFELDENGGLERSGGREMESPLQQKTEWISSEVIVRKKRDEEPVVRLKEEPAAEDKVKEEALIHRIAENPRDVEAYRDLGDYYMNVGNIKDAKDSFKMVLKLRPRDLKAKSSLREIEMKMRLGS